MMASQINATHSSAQKHAIGDSGGNSNQNIYLTFEEVAQKQPSKTAVVIPIIHHQREVTLVVNSGRHELQPHAAGC